MIFLALVIPCLFIQVNAWAIRYNFVVVDPAPEWAQNYQAKFDELGVVNFSMSVAHILHGLTVEDAMTSLNIRLPNENGIPGVNPDLSADDSEALLANLPSRPNEYSSPGMHGFVDNMDHINNPNWTTRGTKLGRILHLFHMQEMWAVAKKTADGFSGVSDDICKGALDHANNGIEEAVTVVFKFFKYIYPAKPNTTLPGAPDKGLTWDDNGESWKEWKAVLPSHHLDSGLVKSMGLYVQCLMRKFRPTEQPIEVDGCCDSKTVGEYSYTKVSTGEVPTKCLNNCIYTRDDKPGSKYCFASGEQEVHCLDSSEATRPYSPPL